MAGAVFMVEPVEIVAADLKGGNTSGRILDPDPAQITAFGQDKGPDEDVRGLVMLGDKSSPPYFVPKTSCFKNLSSRIYANIANSYSICSQA